MIGTELAYVRDRLKRCSLDELREAGEVADASVKTLRRILRLKKYHPSAITVGKLALHFKTRELRA